MFNAWDKKTFKEKRCVPFLKKINHKRSIITNEVQTENVFKKNISAWLLTKKDACIYLKELQAFKSVQPFLFVQVFYARFLYKNEKQILALRKQEKEDTYAIANNKKILKMEHYY